MIKFNDENIFVGEIKQLLSCFNLPNFPIYSKDVNYSEGQFYLKNNTVYVIKNGVETKVSNYYFNKELLNLTRNLEIRNLIYDTYTHVYLGEFLRFIRDYLNLDLMSLYNCFTNKTANNININKNNIIFNSNSTDCVIFEVPIKYDKQYTIAIDCSTKIELLPCILTDNSLKIKEEDIYVNNYQTISNSLFKKPFIYSSPKKQDLGKVNWYEKERNLKLLLKIPSNCNSSIVILEGDYRLNANIIISTPYKEKITKVIFDNNKNISKLTLPTKSQLLYLNTKTVNLLADKLVAYLLQNVITHIDAVTDNIKYVQHKLIEMEYLDKNKNMYFGVWDDNIRKAIYQLAKNTSIKNTKLIDNSFDLLFYVDKDIEKIFK